MCRFLLFFCFFLIHEGFSVTVTDCAVWFMSLGVKHSVLRQVGEGLLSARSGAGGPVAKALYRGGRNFWNFCLNNITLPESTYCILVIMLLCMCRRAEDTEQRRPRPRTDCERGWYNGQRRGQCLQCVAKNPGSWATCKERRQHH